MVVVSTGVGFVACALALVIHRWGIGPGWFQGRAAAILAMLGLQSVLRPARAGVQRLTTSAVDWVAQLAGRQHPEYSAAVHQYLLPILVAVVGIFWVAAMLPNRWAGKVGSVAAKEFNTSLIWGGAFILGFLSSALNSQWGDILTTLLRSLTNAVPGVVRFFVG